MYLVPYSSVPFAYDLLAGAGDRLTLTLPVPNSIALVQRGVELGVQAIHADLVNGCWDMSRAYHIPIVAF